MSTYLLGQWSADDNISGIILSESDCLRNFCELKHYFAVKRKLNKTSNIYIYIYIYTSLFKEVKCIGKFMKNNILLLDYLQ